MSNGEMEGQGPDANLGFPIEDRKVPGDGATGDSIPSAQVLSRSFELLENYKRGDEQALEELIKRYYPRMHQIARRRMRPAQRALAGSMDVVQETFFVALRGLAQFEFRNPDALRRYLSAILNNQLRDLWKRSRHIRGNVSMNSHGGEDSSSGPEPASREPQPFEQLSEQEFLEIRADCASRLAPRARNVLLLKEVTSASWGEIAKDCGYPNDHAAEQAYQRAKGQRDLCVLRKVRF